MAFNVPVIQDIMPPRSPLRHPEMALIKLCRHLPMLAQMLLRQEKMAPMAADGVREQSSALCGRKQVICRFVALDHIQTDICVRFHESAFKP